MRLRRETVRWVRFGVYLTAAFVIACGADVPETEPAAAGVPELQPLPSVAPVPEELPELVARVNSHDVTREELERAVRSAEIQAGQALPTQFRDQVYRSVLDRLVSFHLLVQESETMGISVDEAGVDARIENIRASFPDEAAFESQLDTWQTTLETLREETRRDLLVEGVLESAALTDIEVDVETTREFYDQHAEEFIEGGGATARHILIGISPDATDEEKSAAKARADSIRQDLEGGADFAELARTHSEDPGSAANGGDLGVVARGQTVPEFEAALFALEPGGLSGAVETAFGFHVIQLVERQAERIVPFEEASPEIRDFLLQEEQLARITAFIDELKAKSDIEILI